LSGTLFGVGVGPGDPELVTRKAWRLIGQASVVAYPKPDNAASFARAIVAEAIAEDAEEIAMVVPMRAERFPAQDIYADASETIAARLDQHKNVVVLCEGDPFFYGSFMYLFARLADRYVCEIVPGVCSVMAVAAALKRPICGRNDVVTVVPATLPASEIEQRIDAAEAVAVIKLGRHMAKVRKVLERLELARCTGYVGHASLPQEQICRLNEAPENPPYFSMLLIYKGTDPWLR